MASQKCNLASWFGNLRRILKVVWQKIQRWIQVNFKSVLELSGYKKIYIGHTNANFILKYKTQLYRN